MITFSITGVETFTKYARSVGSMHTLPVFTRWLEFKDKEFYYIMTAAEDTDTVMNCTLECFRGLAECLEGSAEKGVIYGKGVYQKGEILDKKAMQEAYEMGKSIN